MKFAPMVISILLVGLFAIAFINFGLYISVQNNPSQTIGNDPALQAYITSINNTLSKQYGVFNESEDSFSNSQVSLGNSQSGVILDAISGVWKSMKSGFTAVASITLVFLKNTLFAGSEYLLVFGLVSGIIILLGLIAIVRLVMQGDGG